MKYYGTMHLKRSTGLACAVAAACFFVMPFVFAIHPAFAFDRGGALSGTACTSASEAELVALSLPHDAFRTVEFIPSTSPLPDFAQGDLALPKKASTEHELSIASETVGVEAPGDKAFSHEGDPSVSVCTSDLQKLNQGGPDWPGLKRDTYHIFVYQAISVGILYSLPESATNWTKDQKHYGVGKWLDRTRKIHWDRDSWLFNYVQHPYWGAGYYVRARERGFDRRDSFLYSVAMSTIYEFIVEGQFERPSIQDLVATPVIGSLAGSYFETVRGRIRAKETTQWYDDVLMVVTDPLGSLNHLVDGIFGIGPREKVRCSFLLPEKSPSEERPLTGLDKLPVAHVQSSKVIGLEVSFDW